MDNFLGEIRLFSYVGSNVNKTIDNTWLPCHGQLLNINQYQALYTLIGFQFGGDKKTNFNLPNLNGRTIIGTGKSPFSGTTYQTGDAGGAENVVLTTSNLPQHTHTVNANEEYDTIVPISNFPANTNVAGSSVTPNNANLGTVNLYIPTNKNPLTNLNPETITEAGGGGGHENRMPFLCQQYYIAYQGIYPPRP